MPRRKLDAAEKKRVRTVSPPRLTERIFISFRGPEALSGRLGRAVRLGRWIRCLKSEESATCEAALVTVTASMRHPLLNPSRS
jgi:hypothetical protein